MTLGLVVAASALLAPPRAGQRAPRPAPVAPVEAVAETCRYHLDCYGAWVHGHRPARHHQVWLERITALLEGRSARRKLLLLAPPGHAKTTWVSLILPPWYLGRHPDHSLLCFTSADTVAGQLGGTVRHTLEGGLDRHPLVFPDPRCRPDLARGWSSDGLYLAGTPATGKDPAYRALGYGAAVIGARAHGILLDDPLTQARAESEIECAAAQRYFDMTVDSRLHPDGWMLAIMTRWSEGDLASHLLARPDWDVLALPALGDPALGQYPWGRALWPERFSEAWLEKKRAEIGGPLFECLYGCNPAALGGPIFRDGRWFRPLPEGFTRQGLGVLQFWDLNLSGTSTGDYAACATAAVARDATASLLGMFRDRLEGGKDPGTGEWTFGQAHEDALVEQVRLWQPHWVGVEQMAYKQRAVIDLVQRVQRRVAVPVTPVAVSTDKVMRARLPAARAEAGLLYVDRQASWFPAFEAEARAFPLGAHDDQVDALSGVCALAVEALARWKAAVPVQAHFAGRR